MMAIIHLFAFRYISFLFIRNEFIILFYIRNNSTEYFSINEEINFILFGKKEKKNPKKHIKI